MVAHDQHPHLLSDDAEQDVAGKARQIRPPDLALPRGKTARLIANQRQSGHQVLEERVSQRTPPDLVVIPEELRGVALDSAVQRERHRSRAASTARRNSASEHWKAESRSSSASRRTCMTSAELLMRTM